MSHPVQRVGLGGLTAATAATASASSLAPTGSSALLVLVATRSQMARLAPGAARLPPLQPRGRTHSADNQVNLYQFDEGEAFANWTGSVDLAVGAIYSGERGQAAAGAS